jgi:hypothetical protein
MQSPEEKTDLPEAVKVVADSITKPKGKVPKERTDKQKAAFAKAQEKRIATMHARKVAKAQAVVDDAKSVVVEEVVAPVVVEAVVETEPEAVAKPEKKKRAPRKKKVPVVVDEDVLPPPAVLDNKVVLSAPPDIPDIPATAAAVPASAAASRKVEKKMPKVKDTKETLVTIKKRAKKEKPVKEIVYEDSDTESDDETLLAEVYQTYKQKLKLKKAERDAVPQQPAVTGMRFV